MKITLSIFAALGIAASSLATAQIGDQLTLGDQVHGVHGMNLPPHILMKLFAWAPTNGDSLAQCSANWDGLTLYLSVRNSMLYVDRIARDVGSPSNDLKQAEVPLDYAFGQTNSVLAIWFTGTLSEDLGPFEVNSGYSTNQCHYIFEYGVLTKRWRIQESLEKTPHVGK